MSDEKEQQYFFMKEALKEGQRGRITAPPNPWVGAVVVSNGKIVGRGYHHKPGEKHAEIMALEEAKEKAMGSTLYVTLEPCTHFGRTPPCVDAIIKAKVKEVVIPFLDPDSLVAGKGVEKLEKAGIHVKVGVLEEQAAQSLEPYLVHRKRKRPFCILKMAISLDGKIAAQDGSSKWISNELSRLDAHKLRAESQAILIGTKTALKDLPKLTVRHPDIKMEKQPLRVVLDRFGKLDFPCPLLDQNEAKTLIFTTPLCSKKTLQFWKDSSVDVEVSFDETIHLESLLDSLGKRGILQLMVEGGAKMASSFIQSGFIDKAAFYITPSLLGLNAVPFCLLDHMKSMNDKIELKLESITQYEDDIRADYRFQNLPCT